MGKPLQPPPPIPLPTPITTLSPNRGSKEGLCVNIFGIEILQNWKIGLGGQGIWGLEVSGKAEYGDWGIR